MITSVYLTALFVPVLALARLTNVTIDDEAGDPLSGAKLTYNDDECSWIQGANCDSCDVQPDPSRAYMHTWHMSYFMDEYCTIDVQFNGQAVYVFYIVANQVSQGDSSMSLLFFLDGVMSRGYFYDPESTEDYDYNIPVYANSDIESGLHNLTIISTGLGSALLLFDSVVYTIDKQEEQSSAPPITLTKTALFTTTAIRTQVASVSSVTKSQTQSPSPSNVDDSTTGIRTESKSQFSTSTDSQSTFVAPTSSPPQLQEQSSRVDSTPIIGYTIGGVTLIFALVTGLYYCGRIKRNRTSQESQPRPVSLHADHDYDDLNCITGAPVMYPEYASDEMVTPNNFGATASGSRSVANTRIPQEIHAAAGTSDDGEDPHQESGENAPPTHYALSQPTSRIAGTSDSYPVISEDRVYQALPTADRRSSSWNAFDRGYAHDPELVMQWIEELQQEFGHMRSQLEYLYSIRQSDEAPPYYR